MCTYHTNNICPICDGKLVNHTKDQGDVVCWGCNGRGYVTYKDGELVTEKTIEMIFSSLNQR